MPEPLDYERPSTRIGDPSVGCLTVFVILVALSTAASVILIAAAFLARWAHGAP